jgi:hypothetical protein
MRTRANTSRRCGASLAAHPALVSWLDRQPSAGGATALVVGCGVGDDAEELVRRGIAAEGSHRGGQAGTITGVRLASFPSATLALAVTR